MLQALRFLAKAVPERFYLFLLCQSTSCNSIRR
jgi:hypothetical protein